MEKRKKWNIIVPIIIVAVACVIALLIVLLPRKENLYRLIKVNGYEGSVIVEREGEEALTVFEGLQLISEDMVSVEEKAFLELLADSDKHIGAEENTGFVLHAEGDSENGRIAIDLLYGKALFTIDSALSEGDSFEVTTPNATLSVRGTSFSVAYDPVTGETTVEVLDGTVWATYNGMTEELHAGDIRIIGGAGAQEMPLITGGESQEQPVFMISRYFDIPMPEGENSFNQSLEFTYCNGKDYTVQTNPMDNPPDTLNPLEASTIQINNEYIEPVMNQVDALIEERGDEILRAYIDESDYLFTDVTDWFGSFDNKQITIQDADGTISFEYTMVKVGWVYSEIQINEEEGSYMDYEDLCHIDENGVRYALSGVSFTFYE